MLKLLQIEWMKIKNYRVFQVFSALYFLGMLIVGYGFYKVYLSLVSSVTKSFTGIENEGDDALGIFISDVLPYTVCFFTSLLLYLPGMIIINLFINEVNFKTHRQNIIDGWKRETFIHAKIGLIGCFSVAIAVINLIAVLIMSAVTKTDLSVDIIKVVAFSMVQAFVYLMFALLLATFFRRSGVAIIVYFIYGLLLELLLMWALGKIHPSASYFLPLQVADSLIPFVKLKDFYLHKPSEWVLLAASVLFASAYVFFTVRKYKYDDL